MAVPLGRDHLPADQVLDAAATTDGTEVDPPGGARASSRRPCAGARRRGSRYGAAGGSDDGRATVLVADDNADMRDYIVGMLQGSLRRARGGRRAAGARARPGPRPRPRAQRCHDAAAGRVRPACMPCAMTRSPPAPRSCWCPRAPVRRRPSRASRPAPTTTWSSPSRARAAGPGEGEPRARAGAPQPPRRRGQPAPARRGPAPGRARELGDRRRDAARSGPPASWRASCRWHRRSSRDRVASSGSSTSGSTPTTESAVRR